MHKTSTFVDCRLLSVAVFTSSRVTTLESIKRDQTLNTVLRYFWIATDLYTKPGLDNICHGTEYLLSRFIRELDLPSPHLPNVPFGTTN